MDQPRLYRVARKGHRWGDVLNVGTLVLGRIARDGEWVDTSNAAVLVVALEGVYARPHPIAARILDAQNPAGTAAPAFVYDPAVLEAMQ